MHQANMERLKERMREVLTLDVVLAVDTEPEAQAEATYGQIERNFANDWRIPLFRAHVISLVVQSERRQEAERSLGN